MLWLIGFLFYAIIVGLIAKAIMPAAAPVGLLSTIVVGVVGSYVGGLINFLIGRGEFGQTSGIILGIVGGIVALWIWRWWNTQQAGVSFWNGK
ncbi:MAG: GlsB/YeaQ/YmgE family stress response membrane protein [Proteobacteria bacterium]|jgi:uncharacterized membrane protein YeaQ/YmgE (transglycosylase-associated protein family)|nr:GlsB/YeaQ/YmgE family stress response membrane protein [Pseudomonadota bacterium]